MAAPRKCRNPSMTSRVCGVTLVPTDIVDTDGWCGAALKHLIPVWLIIHVYTMHETTHIGLQPGGTGHFTGDKVTLRLTVSPRVSYRACRRLSRDGLAGDLSTSRLCTAVVSTNQKIYLLSIHFSAHPTIGELLLYRYLCVCPSVRLSNACIVTKRNNRL